MSAIDSRELTEWQIYERETGPLGGERLDRLAADIVDALIRVNTPAKDQHKIKDPIRRWNHGGTDGDDS
ncbi:hypothetical protein [Nonomuraea sp. NPDC050786]|uniref:phage tail assembly protein T n=1 Tax=Nonomuraea sp. NPDC050786 TaxID=3154840 RepID=UPI0033D62073